MSAMLANVLVSLEIMALVVISFGRIGVGSEESRHGCLKRMLAQMTSMRDSSESQPTTRFGNHTVNTLIR